MGTARHQHQQNHSEDSSVHNDRADVRFPPGGLAVVVGASGAIGQALVGLLDKEDDFAGVVGWSRGDAPSVNIVCEASVAQAAERLSAAGRPLRLVLDATGFLHDDEFMPEKSWRQLDPDHLTKSFIVNALGPALLMKHLLPLLPRAGKSVFATLSAKVGSIGDNRLGGWYSYRASKAALNQLVRTAAIELQRRQPEAICVALHPGTVASRISAPFTKAGLNVRSPQEAAASLAGVIRRLAPADTGGFFDYRGTPLPW